MFVWLAVAPLLSLSAFLVTTLTVHAHGGGLGSHGFDHDRKHGGYRCHQGPLAGQ